jgi:hypothetical protein
MIDNLYYQHAIFFVDFNQISNLYTGGNGEVSEFIGRNEGLDFCEDGFYSAGT